jgi:hypothetical protein
MDRFSKIQTAADEDTIKQYHEKIGMLELYIKNIKKIADFREQDFSDLETNIHRFMEGSRSQIERSVCDRTRAIQRSSVQNRLSSFIAPLQGTRKK